MALFTLRWGIIFIGWIAERVVSVGAINPYSHDPYAHSGSVDLWKILATYVMYDPSQSRVAQTLPTSCDAD